MTTNQKLILLNGFAASGKTTLTKKYIDSHTLALGLEHDELVVMLGQWEKNENESREKVFKIMKSIITTHLQSGNDVIIPYLLTDHMHAEIFEKIAIDADIQFHEIFILKNKETAITHLLERGRWGEKGLPPLTEKDFPSIEKLYNTMINETAKRPNMVKLEPVWKDIDATYKLLMDILSK